MILGAGSLVETPGAALVLRTAKRDGEQSKEKRVMAESTKALNGKRIGVFGKGGSGKSTATVLLAKALGDCGYPVCILDADSTNVGLHQALGLDKSPASLMNHFGGTVFSGGTVTCPVDDPTPLAGAEISLHRLPSRYYVRTQGGMVFLTAGKIGDQGPGAGCDGPISKIARDFRIIAEGERPVTLVDFKAGFEDSARGVITSLDWAVVIVDPTSASIQIAANMKAMVDQIKAGILPATSHLESPELVAMANRVFKEARIKGVFFVLSQVDAATESYLREKLKENGIRPAGVIHRDPSISLSWLKGLPLDVTETREDLEKIVGVLEISEEAYSAGS
jgi:CO dehydrogenase nickel-insertion accessory protein CooC1